MEDCRIEERGETTGRGVEGTGRWGAGLKVGQGDGEME